MKLRSLRLSNFQSFGPEPTSLDLEEITYLIGPNGAGKTAALIALSRMFGFDPSMRKVQRSDFHVPHGETEQPSVRALWIEADFVFPELAGAEDTATVPPNFAHMRMDDPAGLPRVRFRLSATMGPDGDIEEKFVYVLDVDDDEEPIGDPPPVPRHERNLIHVHYLPARRDPSDHIAYGTNALLGRMLRAVNWESQRGEIKDLTDKISQSLAGNPAIAELGGKLKSSWSLLHKGAFFADPEITFIASEVEALLRHLSVSFSPGHDTTMVDFKRLSDGQKSMLYLSLVLSSQAVGRAIHAGDCDAFDETKFRPPVFTIVALEEPENSLSPHYLGRIVTALNAMVKPENDSNQDSQALIATHAPSMLRRIQPERIRHLRLTPERTTKVTIIKMPAATDDAHKFVREAIQAFPEVYFARLVILGEGDSEEIVLPRLLRVKGIPVDESAIVVAPLGGRHVNHFWRLLSDLEIPYITLLDLDLARYQGGWGRIRYVNKQLSLHQPCKALPTKFKIPKWNSDYQPAKLSRYLAELERRDVFFSSPLDLDFSMLTAFPNAYGVLRSDPSEAEIVSVLGKRNNNPSQYSPEEQELFASYHDHFKVGSKPAAHIEALSKRSDKRLLARMPGSLVRLADAVKAKLAELPE